MHFARAGCYFALLLGAACSTSPRGSGIGERHAVAQPSSTLPVSPTPSATLPDAPQGPTSSYFALVGGTVVGTGRADVTIRDGKIQSVGKRAPDAEVVDVSGRFLVPAFIDAHVHLSYYPVAEQLLSRGVVAALDLAAPLDALSTNVQPLTLLSSGPMITAVQGYPTTSWGSGGYGLEVSGPEAAIAAVDQLFQAGAAVIKTPLTSAPTLDDATLKALVERAHAHQLKVFAHALDAANAERAAIAGIDVLAHTPTETLSEETLKTFSKRAVVSTLAAFGGGPGAIANLKELRSRGATVLYGTDLGNTRDAGIQSEEIALLLQAGFDGSAILSAGTVTPADYLGLDQLGRIAAGKRAALLVLELDPLEHPQTLATPLQVYIDGRLRGDN